MDFDDLDDYTVMRVFEKDADKLAEAQAEIERLNVKFEALVDKSLSLVGEAHEYRMEIERLTDQAVRECSDSLSTLKLTKELKVEIERLQKEADAQYEAEGKMLAEVTELYAENELFKAIFKEAADYLDLDVDKAICAGSIFHDAFVDAGGTSNE
jgi:chromosome segregation ATPase